MGFVSFPDRDLDRLEIGGAMAKRIFFGPELGSMSFRGLFGKRRSFSLGFG